MFWAFRGLPFGIYFNRSCDLKKKRLLCGYLTEEIETPPSLVGEIRYMSTVSIDFNLVSFTL